MSFLSKPNFLGSEVGLVLKTVGVDAVTNVASATDEVYNGFTHKIIPAGTLLTVGTYTGLLFQDVDVTNTTATTQKAAPLMIAGYYIDAKLPASISASAEALEAQNLIAIVDRAVTRTVTAITE